MQRNGHRRAADRREDQLGGHVGDQQENDRVEGRSKGEQEKVGEDGAEDSKGQDRLEEGAHHAQEEDDHQGAADDQANHLGADEAFEESWRV